MNILFNKGLNMTWSMKTDFIIMHIAPDKASIIKQAHPPPPPLVPPPTESSQHALWEAFFLSFLMLSMFSSSICFFSFCNCWVPVFFSGSCECWCLIFYEKFQIQLNPGRPSLSVCLQFIKTLRRAWQWLELVVYRQRRCNGTVFHSLHTE